VYNQGMNLLQISAIFGMLLIVAGGCQPSMTYIQLRKDKQELSARVVQLERELDASRSQILAMRHDLPPAVDPLRLDKLYTAHGLSFGRMTRGYQLDPQTSADQGVVVHIVPTDQQGHQLKAAGSFKVSLLDLNRPEEALIGQAFFDLEQSAQAWHGQALLYNYVLRVPFDNPPSGGEVLIRVEFRDELTGRRLTGEKKIQVRL